MDDSHLQTPVTTKATGYGVLVVALDRYCLQVPVLSNVR